VKQNETGDWTSRETCDGAYCLFMPSTVMKANEASRMVRRYVHITNPSYTYHEYWIK